MIAGNAARPGQAPFDPGGATPALRSSAVNCRCIASLPQQIEPSTRKSGPPSASLTNPPVCLFEPNDQSSKHTVFCETISPSFPTGGVGCVIVVTAPPVQSCVSMPRVVSKRRIFVRAFIGEFV
jgi:hypothetical protein